MIDARAIAFEEFPLDRMVDDQGRPEKDVSRAPSRWFEPARDRAHPRRAGRKARDRSRPVRRRTTRPA
jgi:hypothetical protein